MKVKVLVFACSGVCAAGRQMPPALAQNNLMTATAAPIKAVKAPTRPMP